MEQDSFPWEGNFTCGHARGSCPFNILLSLVGHWSVESCIGLAQLQRLCWSPLQGTRGKFYLESDSSGHWLLLTLTSQEGVLESGIRLYKTIFRWGPVKVSFSSLSQSSHPRNGKINLLRKERTCRFIFLFLFFFFFSFLVVKTKHHRRQHNISKLLWIGLCLVHQSFTQPDTGSCEHGAWLCLVGLP